MYTKQWQAEFAGGTIRVENGWNLKGESIETIYINDEIELQSHKDATEISLKEMAGAIYHFPYQQYNIEIKMGSAWHMFGMACSIWVDGKQVGGNRIVLFAKK